MSQDATCESIVVGYRKYCSLTYCRHCDVFQLNIGPMSFRLEKEICEMVCGMMCGVYFERMKSGSKSPAFENFGASDINAIDTDKHNSH